MSESYSDPECIASGSAGGGRGERDSESCGVSDAAAGAGGENIAAAGDDKGIAALLLETEALRGLVMQERKELEHFELREEAQD